MTSIRSLKRISSTGDSLVISVTKEAREMELGKGDSVSVIVSDSEDSVNENFDLACMLSNPNASYENIRCLTPDDTLLDGSPLESFDDELDDEHRVSVSTRIRTWQEIYRITKEFTRNAVTYEHSGYSDSMRSFITEFQPVHFADHKSQIALEQLCELELLGEIVKRSRLSTSSIKSISSLREHLDIAIHEADVYYDLCPLEDSDVLIEKFNRAWENRLKGDRYPVMWFVGMTITYPVMGEYDDWSGVKGVPDFKLFEGPYRQYVEEQLDAEAETENEADHVISKLVIGPYDCKDDAQDMLSYFRLHARGDGGVVDDGFFDWCKTESRRIMDV